MTEDNGIKVYMETLNKALIKIGRPPATAKRMRKHLEDAGFINVKVFDIKQPFGPWPMDPRLKRVGGMVRMKSTVVMAVY